MSISVFLHLSSSVVHFLVVGKLNAVREACCHLAIITILFTGSAAVVYVCVWRCSFSGAEEPQRISRHRLCPDVRLYLPLYLRAADPWYVCKSVCHAVMSKLQITRTCHCIQGHSGQALLGTSSRSRLLIIFESIGALASATWNYQK